MDRSEGGGPEEINSSKREKAKNERYERKADADTMENTRMN